VLNGCPLSGGVAAVAACAVEGGRARHGEKAGRAGKAVAKQPERLLFMAGEIG